MSSKSSLTQSRLSVSLVLTGNNGASKDRIAAMAVIEDMNHKSVHGYVPRFNLAIVYLGIGDYESTMDFLEQAYSAHSQLLVLLKMDRIFDPLRKDPRFRTLMKKLNFAT